jgi:hypothetical protein
MARAWVHLFGPEMTKERVLALEAKRKLGHDAIGVMEGASRP